MADVGHLAAELFFDAEILRDHHTDVKLLFVKALRQRTDNVRQSSGLDERNRLGCNK